MNFRHQNCVLLGIIHSTKMKQIAYIPHVADVCLEIKGNTINELFEAGLEGMANLLSSKVCVPHEEVPLNETITLTSIDVTALLIDFLSKVLTVSYVDKAVFRSFDSLEINGNKLVAVIVGYSVKEFDEDIKAVTHHGAEVKKGKEGQWETNVLFDI